MSLTSRGRACFAPCQRQDLVRAHAGGRGAAEDLQGQASSNAFTGRAPGLANEGVIPGHLELDFRMRQKAQPVPNLLRDGDLPFGGDLHGNTPTGKCSPVAIRFAMLRLGRRRNTGRLFSPGTRSEFSKTHVIRRLLTLLRPPKSRLALAIQSASLFISVAALRPASLPATPALPPERK